MSSVLAASPLSQQIVAAATEVLKTTVGENIEHIAAKVAEKVPGTTVADIIPVIDKDWREITADAGMGPFSFQKFSGAASDTRRVDLKGTVAGQMLPHGKSVGEVLSSARQRAVGTVDARQFTINEGKKSEETFVVQGPQYWELMNHTKPFERNVVGRFIDSALSFVSLDGVREKVGYDLTRLHIKREWSTGAKEKALRGISGTEIEALTQPGPNGEPASLQPGDALLCGGGGDGGLTHCILYAGPAPANHPDAGAPMIVHAMATLKEGSSLGEWIRDEIHLVNNKVLNDLHLTSEQEDSMTGVLYERLGHFFNRYHRDSIMIVRDATLGPAQIEKGLAHARQLAGYDDATGKIDLEKRVPYDYKLAPDDLVSMPQEGDAPGRREYLAKYCTEVWLAFDYVAHDGKREELPYVGTAHYNQGSPFGTFGLRHTFIAEPEDLSISPDLQPVLVAGGGANALAEAQRLRLQAPVAFMPRASRVVPQRIASDV